MKWNELSMAERAKYIQLGVNSGITSLAVIRNAYNIFKDGGRDLNSEQYSGENNPAYLKGANSGKSVEVEVVYNPKTKEYVKRGIGYTSSDVNIYKATGGRLNILGSGGYTDDSTEPERVSLLDMPKEKRQRVITLRDAERQRQQQLTIEHLKRRKTAKQSDTSNSYVRDAYLIQEALESQVPKIDPQVSSSFEESKKREEELKRGYMEDNIELADKFLKSVELATVGY